MSIQITDNINSILIIRDGIETYIPKSNTVITEEAGGYFSIYHSGSIIIRDKFSDVTIPVVPDVETLCSTITSMFCDCSATSTAIGNIETLLTDIAADVGKTYYQRTLTNDFPGTFPGNFSARKIGLTIGVEEQVWEYSTAAYPFPDYLTPALLDIVSDNANDDGIAPLTGANVLAVVGLDAGGNIDFDVVTLNGLTPVSTAKQFIRVLVAYVASAGTTGTNEGNITVSYLGNVIEYIKAGNSIGSKAVGTVPSNHGMFINIKMIASDASNTNSAPITFRIYNRDINSGVVQKVHEVTTKSDVELTDLPVNGFNDVWVTAQCNTVGAVVSANVNLKSIISPL